MNLKKKFRRFRSNVLRPDHRSKWIRNDPAPFFSSESEAVSYPRLLLIAYHFPPAQSAGALRWEKLAGYAVERGWGLDVIAIDPQDAQTLDWNRLTALPKGVRIY